MTSASPVAMNPWLAMTFKIGSRHLFPIVGKSLVEASARARPVARRSRLEWHAGVLHT
jgi:hypothetical protein